jgi:hypothetical protein
VSASKKLKKPRKPAIKPTEKERDDRVDELIDFIANRPAVSRYKIHRRFTKKWNVCWATVDRYLSRAREALRTNLNRSKDEVRSNAVAFYEQIISNPLEQTKDRIKSQQLLVELLGLAQPTKVEMSGPNQGPIITATTGLDNEAKSYIKSMSVEQLKDALGKMKTMDKSSPLAADNR